jgi:hypothetical protein
MPTISNDEIASSVRTKLNEAINKVDGVTPFTNDVKIAAALELPASTTETRNIEVGKGRTGNGYAFIDLIGDATYPDYGTRLVRENTGANARSVLNHRGSGDLVLNTNDGAPVVLSPANSIKLGVFNTGSTTRIYKTGGDTYDNSNLELVTTTGNVTLGFHAAGATAVNLRHVRGTVYLQVTDYNSGAFAPIQASAFQVNSDYRLKENVVPLENATDRLLQLPVYRFNFKEDSMSYQEGRTVDGFIAHEVQAIVPEAISGFKDEVDQEGNPLYQGIDQAKLVPLLTAALQEAIERIKSLEDRVALLEAQPE